MPRNVKKYLWDMQQAIERLNSFVHDMDFDEYQRDIVRRSAVERHFEIIGEALNQMLRLDGSLADHISHTSEIIGFRNILIHGYAEIDNRRVWEILHERLPLLRQQIDALLNAADERDKPS